MTSLASNMDVCTTHKGMLLLHKMVVSIRHKWKMVVVPSHWEKWMFLLYTMVVVMRARLPQQQQQQLWLRWSKGCVKFMIKLRDGSIICSLLCIFCRRGSRWMVGMVLLVFLQPRVFPAPKTNLHSSWACQRWSILWRHRSPEPQLLPWLLPR